ncbi:MAG: AtpZ/AtpI family protein [Firmicutes bacterium]|jgi:hypothetical protein|nr:AtpZ/AtpI family protein [Bacillota bacterium]MDD4335936.1 AtpZ/AtpI family protein [Bacillota bacterium]MDD4791852.1 AtpZ/AtpI family protein [Bacillota bacterium]
MTRLLLAVEIASFILMGFVIGSFIDSRQGTRPWGTIIGFLVGLSLGAMSVRRAIDEIALRAASGSGRKVVKFVRCPIQVQTDSETGEPVSFNYRGMNYAVSEVLRNWRDFTLLDKEMSGRGGKATDWWLSGHGKLNYRVRTEDGIIWDLQYDERKLEWILDKLLEQKT